MSLDLLTQYIDHALTFERVAAHVEYEFAST